jgi:hypothetical protein
MANQETIERDGRYASRRDVTSRNLADFAHDLTTIVELQARLFVTDVRQVARGFIVAAALLAVASIVFTAMVVVGLLGLAHWIAGMGNMSVAASHGLIASLAAAASVVLVAAAWFLGRHHASSLQRSQTELERNVAWIKSVCRARGSMKQSPRGDDDRKNLPIGG